MLTASNGTGANGSRGLKESDNCGIASPITNTLREELTPRTPIEESLVEDLATYRWRQRRLLCMETACFTQEIRLQDPEAAAGTSAGRATTAFTTLTSSSRTLDLLHRYELRFNREFNRTLQRLKALRGTGPENG